MPVLKKSASSGSCNGVGVVSAGGQARARAKVGVLAGKAKGGGFSSSSTSTSESSSSGSAGGPDHLLSALPGDAAQASSWPSVFFRKMFRSHGEFCASQPWEVIVATFMFLVCFLTVLNKRYANEAAAPVMVAAKECQASAAPSSSPGEAASFLSSFTASTFFLSLMSCLSVARVTLHFHKIHAIGSHLVWKIAFFYLFFTFLLFSLVVLSVERPGAHALQDCWFLIPLFADLSKVTRMAQFALSSSHYRRISEKVANGMHVLAPSFFLDTVAWTLFSTLGFFIDIDEVSMFAKYTVVALLVNFFVYVSFYPAALSLVLELMFCSDGRPRWNVKQIIYTLPKEEGQSPNSHRVRVVVIAVTSILHIYLRPAANLFQQGGHQHPEWLALITANIEKILMMTSVVCVSAYYLFNSDIDEAREMRTAYIAELTREFAEERETTSRRQAKSAANAANAAAGSGNNGSGRSNDADLDPSSNSTDEGISLSSSSTHQAGTAAQRRGSGVQIAPGIDDSSSESTWSEVGFLPDLKDQEVQTTDSLTSSSSSSSGPPSSEDDETSARNAKRKVKKQQSNSGGSNGNNSNSSNSAPSFTARPTITTTPSSTPTSPRHLSPMSSAGQPTVVSPAVTRPLEECLKIKNATPEGVLSLSDQELVQLVAARHIRSHTLEAVLKDPERAVDVRRKVIERETGVDLEELPFVNYDYGRVQNACCESVIGYMPLPVGKAGPLRLDGHDYTVPMATTEGCLVASVNRGCRALRENGVKSYVYDDGMTRGPIVRFECAGSVTRCIEWLDHPDNFADIKSHFDSTSRFARLQELKCRPAGRELYIRFKALTGDAMGMNMLSKATEQALRRLNEVFPRMEIMSLSGNFCTDKKPAAINWLNGRGKSVVCEALVPRRVVAEVLKTTPERLVDLNKSKNLVGSAIAGSIGGFNAQASNVVTAIFIATGQDAAQNVASSNCLTQMEVQVETGDLYITATMPSIEVGTVGGGTILAPQSTCLSLLGVKGSHPSAPGENAKQLARVVAGTVLAGELSLMSALAEGHLVKSHMRHNRSVLSMAAAAAAADSTIQIGGVCKQ